MSIPIVQKTLYFWVKKFITWHVEIASTNIAPIVFRCHMFRNFQFILTVTIDDMNKQSWGENQYESFCVKCNRAYTLGIVVVNYGISLLGQGHSCFFFLLSFSSQASWIFDSCSVIHPKWIVLGYFMIVDIYLLIDISLIGSN